MAKCEDTNFTNQHGGLQVLTPLNGDRFPIYRQRFKDMIKQITLKIPGLTAAKAAKIKDKLVVTQGYYIGKEQLKCVLDNEFGKYDGVQITLGLSNDAASGTAQIVLLLKGAFETDSAPKGTTLSMGEHVDNRYFDESDVTYVAGPPLSGTVPPPNSMPDPPYGRG